MRIYYTTFKSPVGEILATRTEKGLNLLAFPRNRWERFLAALKSESSVDLRRDEKRFSLLKKELKSYFSGREVRFKFPVDLGGGTAFQKRVWDTMRRIPPGETRSYGWLAGKMGSKGKARAVGAACGANPVPIIIPCHRVVREDGSLGGYAGGLNLKRKLLRLEGVKI